MAAAKKDLGVLGGDLAGYLNGRRVFDDVVTIELRALAGLTIPEKFGGRGLGPLETCVVHTELGRALYPGPFLPGGVAAGVTFPVEVLMKSAPAIIASQDARETLSSVASSPVSRITFR